MACSPASAEVQPIVVFWVEVRVVVPEVLRFEWYHPLVSRDSTAVPQSHRSYLPTVVNYSE